MNQKISSEDQLSLQVEKAYTFFIVPFYYDTIEEWNSILSKLDRWKPVSENLYNKEDVLYPYIMDLFQQSSSTQKQSLDIYKFTPCKERFDAPEGRFSKTLFPERILGQQSVAFIGKNAKEKNNPQVILFTLMDEGNMAPHLFISPTAKIGIMTFCIQLDEVKDMETVKVLNYFLHKRDERDKYQCVCPKPENQKGMDITLEANRIYKETPDFWKLHQGNTRFNEDFICWNTNDLVNCMLATFGISKPGVPRIKYFSSDRIHLFTFCSLQDIANKITSECLYPDMMRLARCVDNSYMLPFSQLYEQGHFMETFENIYFSSAIEGASMVCVGKEGNKEFIMQIHNKFSRQYLIVYLLVLIQRFTLLRLEQMMTAFESTEKIDDDLWNLINIICRIKVNCYYTDVSVYTHYSQFYQFCCRNLLIQQTFQEVGEKIELLKLTTDRKLQQVVEAQRKIQEEEAKKLEEERERARQQQEKEERQHQIDKANEAEAKDAAERRQHILNGIVGILTIAQVMQAAYELLKDEENKDIVSLYISLCVGAVCSVLLITLMWKDIREFICKLFK